MSIRQVQIEDVLRARDARVQRQRGMLAAHASTLISFTMNIAGPIKNDPWIERGFQEGVFRIESVLRARRIPILDSNACIAFTGCEKIWCVDAQPESAKRWMRLIEEQDALGRLFDIDVIAPDGSKIERAQERLCLICNAPVRSCARSRAHSAEMLYKRTHEILESFFRDQFAERVSGLAQRALLCELAVTPKPGLVDFENSGAHRDMDRFTFINSACLLRAYFEQCVRIGMQREKTAFERIRSLGQQAESAMLKATDGVNTHKGALFSLGILCCAAGMQFGGAFSIDALFQCGAELAKASLSDFEQLPTAQKTGGEAQYVHWGLTGARGEAALGFPSVREVALPALRQALAEGCDWNDAALTALLALMRVVSDSNVLRRAGCDGLRTVQREAQQAEMEHASLREMNARFEQLRLSPGGCADLLAVAFFVHFVDREKNNGSL